MTTKQRESAARETANPKVRMPVEVRNRIDRLTADLVANYEAGRCELPEGVDCDNIPRWAVLVKALDELESHRERSRNRKSNKLASTTPSF